MNPSKPATYNDIEKSVGLLLDLLSALGVKSADEESVVFDPAIYDFVDRCAKKGLWHKKQYMRKRLRYETL